MRVMKRIGAGCAAVALAGVLQAVPYLSVQAATATVTTNANSGVGSLRAAIAAAASGDTITFAPALSGQTITLTSVITINNNVTVDATGLVVTISGGTTTQVFSVPAGKTVSLKHLTIKNGSATLGGALLNQGTVTISGSTFTGNHAASGGGAIDNAAALTITDSTFSANTNAANDGGAILNATGGNLTLRRTVFADNVNSGRHSGAVENEGTSMVVDHSSFIHNTTALDGGAISDDGDGMVVTNSTFSGNIAQNNGGALWNGDKDKISSSTFAGNHAAKNGGAFEHAPLQIADSIIAGNTITASNTPSNCSDPVAPTADKGFNLQFGDATCALVAATDVTGDPKLGTAQDNGAGLPTQALGSGSAAIDKGTCTDPNAASAVITTDERGVPRPQGPKCDIGAFESDTVPPAVSTAFPAPSGANGTYTGTVSGTVTAADSGLVERLTCTGATLTNVTGLGTASASGTLTVSGSGTHNIVCTATDLSGNQGTHAATITIAVPAASPTPALPKAGAAGPTRSGGPAVAVALIALIAVLALPGVRLFYRRKTVLDS